MVVCARRPGRAVLTRRARRWRTELFESQPPAGGDEGREREHAAKRGHEQPAAAAVVSGAREAAAAAGKWRTGPIGVAQRQLPLPLRFRRRLADSSDGAIYLSAPLATVATGTHPHGRRDSVRSWPFNETTWPAPRRSSYSNALSPITGGCRAQGSQRLMLKVAPGWAVPGPVLRVATAA